MGCGCMKRRSRRGLAGLRDPKLNDVGETEFRCTDDFGQEKVLKVKRIRQGTWFAKIVGDKQHARWGDKRQIQEDVSTFLRACALPVGKRMW